MRFAIRFLFLAMILAMAQPIFATQARITKITRQVRISLPKTKTRPAALNDLISNLSEIQTGKDSQAELRFDNGTLVRLAADTFCRMLDGSREMELERGAILVRAPKNAGKTIVATGTSSSSSLGGTTSILERYPQAHIKLIALDGTARMFMPGVIGESVLVNAGQLLMFHTTPPLKSLPNPVDVDLKRLMATSLLIKGFAPLESEGAIATEVKNQKKQKSEGALADTNLVIFGRGTLVSLVPPSASPTPSPNPRQKPSPTGAPR